MVGPNAGQPSAAAGMGPGGAVATPDAIPDIRKPDYQLLMQDLAQSRREVFEERREKDRRVNEERDRARLDQEQIRKEFNEKLRDADRENNALITALGRLRGENDGLREQIAVLKVGMSRSQEPVAAPETARAQGPTAIPHTSPFKKTVVPASEPALGKPVAIDPAKLV